MLEVPFVYLDKIPRALISSQVLLTFSNCQTFYLVLLQPYLPRTSSQRLAPRSVSTKKLALIEHDQGKRMGSWEKLIHPVVRRAYFVNKETGQTCWTTPHEVKWYRITRFAIDFTSVNILGYFGVVGDWAGGDEGNVGVRHRRCFCL